jgi:hypothetical protein
MGPAEEEMSHGTQEKNPKGDAPQGRGAKSRSSSKAHGSGKLRIGDNWNAITIIALSQNNPLKAIAEFVENSIDARAEHVTIVRGKERGQLYLKVIDDGEGIPRDEQGLPDFRYVATHICDSIKKKLKEEGVKGIQGEFGIGLLSFWTVGERMVLSSSGVDGKTYQMEMHKGEQGYSITPRRSLFGHPGTELLIHPLLPGIRQLNGERLQHYLASELRDRIRKSGVEISIKDRQSRKELEVRPQQFSGRFLHQFDVLDTIMGEIYLELYLNDNDQENTVSLFRSGTRVLPSITKMDFFNRDPWKAGYLQGTIDAPFLQLTPGTRDGVVQDVSFEAFCSALKNIEEKLRSIIELEKRAEEEETSRNILKSVQRALKEAFLALPRGEYDWFDIQKAGGTGAGSAGHLFSEEGQETGESGIGITDTLHGGDSGEDRSFYEHAGALFKVIISPATCVIKVNTTRNFRCIPRDRNKRVVERDVDIRWNIKEGGGSLDTAKGEFVTFSAPDEPGLTILQATALQGDAECTAESIITVSETLIRKEGQEGKGSGRGIPGYTFIRATGELWRSKYDEKRNLIIVNNGHKDYIYASQKKARKIKYISRLFAKELVLQNFMGFEPEDLLERMIELTLYTEEHLR